MAIEALLARSVQVFVALLGAYVVVLWFVSIVWTFRDIEARSRNIVTQISATLLSIMFPFLGIPLYLILRPKDTLDGAYQRSLEEEYLIQDLEELPLCPSCQHFVADDFVLCPHCHTQLRDACPSCERLVDLRWSLCPYCGVEQDGRTRAVPAPAAITKVTGPVDSTPKPAPAPAPDVAPAPRQIPVASNGDIGRNNDRAVLSVVGGRKVTPQPERNHHVAETQQVELIVPRRRRFLRPGVDLPADGASSVHAPTSNGHANGSSNGHANGTSENSANGHREKTPTPMSVHADRE